MAVREFFDGAGRAWRAWSVTPDTLRPVARAEDYLEDRYLLGWLVFETDAGDQKRRLCPIPANWHEQSDAELQAMLQRADQLPPRVVAKGRQGAARTSPAPAESARSMLRTRIAQQLRPLCPHLAEDEFARMVDRIAEVESGHVTRTETEQSAGG